MLAAAIAVLDLILFLAVKTDYYICPAFVLAKFYSNNMLVICNNSFPKCIRGGRAEDNETGFVYIDFEQSNGDAEQKLGIIDGLKSMFCRNTPPSNNVATETMQVTFRAIDAQLTSTGDGQSQLESNVCKMRQWSMFD